MPVLTQITRFYEDFVLLPSLRDVTEDGTFHRLAGGGTEFLDSCDRETLKRYVHETWRNYSKSVEDVIKRKLPLNFLRNSVLRQTMVVDQRGRWMEHQVSYLEARLVDPSAILRESYIGKPSLAHHKWMTSHNTIHNMYHIVKYQETCRQQISNATTVCEWGGGYGNCAKLFKRINKGKQSYIIIDLPAFSFIQYVYLSSIFGEDSIHLVREREQQIMEGKVSLVPLDVFPFIDLPKVDAFISTWALSECTQAAQDLVVSRGLLNAQYVLLTYQRDNHMWNTAERVAELAKSCGGLKYNHEIDYLESAGFYAFR